MSWWMERCTMNGPTSYTLRIERSYEYEEEFDILIPEHEAKLFIESQLASGIRAGSISPTHTTVQVVRYSDED